tara:strand:- start:325 stop:1119 length:795 start_codon:yes stop_codon:yes gene_type:complete
MAKETKVVIRRKKFQSVEVPLINTKIELVGNSPEELKDKTIKLDLTRQLKGKGVEAIVKIKIKDKKAVAYPKKIKLMSYFIRRMIRKRISYVEDSFETPSQESIIKIKPFLITRKTVSRAVRKALRNRCKNWIEDYIAERTDDEIFNEVLSNQMQRPLSLSLKKTYPLSLCEIRVLEIKRPLNPNEVPKVKKKTKEEKEQSKSKESIGEGIDQLAEIEAEQKKKDAEKEIKKTQEKAAELEEKPKAEEEKPKKPVKKTTKKEKK